MKALIVGDSRAGAARLPRPTAMTRTRVLVVDDAVVVRRMLTEVLGEDPELEVAGTAANGRIALQKLTQVSPDVVVLDVEMPEMDGLETLKALRQTHPRLPVIMFSTLTERGAAATLDALSLGASDYLTKPANVGSVALAQQHIREQLIPKIRTLSRKVGGVGAGPGMSSAGVVAAASPSRPPGAAVARNAIVTLARGGEATSPVDVIAIGVSTGGPNALAALLPQLPAALPVPIVLVQHMPPMFTRLLAERLNARSAVTVVEAAGGETLTPGVVYVAPGNFHMVVQRRGAAVMTALNQLPPENSCRPAVDPLFRSVSQIYGARTLAVVLTGMGQDGLRGAEAVRAAGGHLLAQDEASSVVWGMPGFVARAGLADRVLPLAEIAGELTRRCMRGTTAAVALGG